VSPPSCAKMFFSPEMPLPASRRRRGQGHTRTPKDPFEELDKLVGASDDVVHDEALQEPDEVLTEGEAPNDDEFSPHDSLGGQSTPKAGHDSDEPVAPSAPPTPVRLPDPADTHPPPLPPPDARPVTAARVGVYCAKLGIDSVAIAKTGLSKCQLCNLRIAQGDERLLYFMSFTNPSRWIHVGCAARIPAKVQAPKEVLDTLLRINTGSEAMRLAIAAVADLPNA
jgi:hypothetical protein